jgi:hypothetical protein
LIFEPHGRVEPVSVTYIPGGGGGSILNTLHLPTQRFVPLLDGTGTTLKLYDPEEEPTFTVTLSPRPLTGQWVLAPLLKQYLVDDEGATVSGKLGELVGKSVHED